MDKLSAMPYWLVESFYREQQASLQYRAKLCHTLKEALDLSTNAVLVRERETVEAPDFNEWRYYYRASW